MPIQKIAKAIICVAALLPLAFYVNDYMSGDLLRPWQELIVRTARWSLRFLIIGLCLTPLAAVTRLDFLRGFGRVFGWLGALYVAVHVGAWARQYGYDWPFLAEEISSHLYLAAGFIGAALLLPVAATWLMRRHEWLELLIYPALAAALIHFAMLNYGGHELPVQIALVAACFVWRLLPDRAVSWLTSTRHGRRGGNVDDGKFSRRRAEA